MISGEPEELHSQAPVAPDEVPMACAADHLGAEQHPGLRALVDQGEVCVVLSGVDDDVDRGSGVPGQDVIASPGAGDDTAQVPDSESEQVVGEEHPGGSSSGHVNNLWPASGC
jgi:hypothetical protein